DGARARYPRLRVIVADRFHPRRYATNYARIVLQPLEETEIAAVLAEHGRDIRELSPKMLLILSLPFFLQLWLTAGDTRPSTKSEMLERALVERAKVKTEEIPALSKMAYDVYAGSYAQYFQGQRLHEIGEGLFGRLASAGYLVSDPLGLLNDGLGEERVR